MFFILFLWGLDNGDGCDEDGGRIRKSAPRMAAGMSRQCRGGLACLVGDSG